MPSVQKPTGRNERDGSLPEESIERGQAGADALPDPLQLRNMALHLATHERLWFPIRPPRTLKYERGHSASFLIRASTNFWCLLILFYSKWIGGFHIAYQHPTWRPGYAAYWRETFFAVYGPKPDFTEHDYFPVIEKHQWTAHLFTDAELEQEIQSYSR
jgi:hypothetical protein